jgi:hypothetical protein
MKPPHIAIAMTGFILACVVASPASGQADRRPRTADIDTKPYLAQAYAESPMQAILLQRMQATCPAQTKRAVMFDRRAPLAWFGCWREREGKVEIAFEDGDFLALAHDSFVWLPEIGI